MLTVNIEVDIMGNIDRYSLEYLHFLPYKRSSFTDNKY